MNELIEKIFKDFTVDGVKIPVSFLRYKGDSETFITYAEVFKDTSFSGDNRIIGYVDYYDIDIYTKGNYLNIVNEVKEKMELNDFTWQPSLDSADMYEDDTGYYHKTLCFAKERME